MQTQDYLKIVIDNLRMAAQSRKQEIDDIVNAIAQRDQSFKDQMKDMKQREAQSLDMAAASDDDRTRSSQMRDAQSLRAEESRAKSSFEQYKRDMDSLLAVKQRNYNDINRVLNEVERNWAGI